jgi:hypothetical protein
VPARKAIGCVADRGSGPATSLIERGGTAGARSTADGARMLRAMAELSLIGSWVDVDPDVVPAYGMTWQTRGAADPSTLSRSITPPPLGGAVIAEDRFRPVSRVPVAGAAIDTDLMAWGLDNDDDEFQAVSVPAARRHREVPRTARTPRELTATEEGLVALIASCALTVATEDWGWSGLDASMFAIAVWLLLRWALTSRP